MAEVCSCGCTNLPPVEVLLVKDLQDVAAVEAKPRLLARNQVIMRRVVIKVTLHKGLNEYLCWKEGTCQSNRFPLNTRCFFFFCGVRDLLDGLDVRVSINMKEPCPFRASPVSQLALP